MEKSKTIPPWTDGGYDRCLMLRMNRAPPELSKESVGKECDMMRDEIWKSECFDIDFDKFHCDFNFTSVELDGDFFSEENETDVILMDALSQLALEAYNEEKRTKHEFVSVVKANWHPSAAFTFYITFQVREANQEEHRQYQAMVQYLGYMGDVIFCRPKPSKSDDRADSLSPPVSLTYVPPELLEPSSLKRPKMGAKGDKHRLSVQDECKMFTEQVLLSGGFDIDFDQFRCKFNFRPVVLDKLHFVDEPETDRDLMNALSKLAIKEHNEEKGTNLEFTRVVKANWRPCSGGLFYITFEVDECNRVKEYQAIVHYLFCESNVILCRSKP